MRKATTFSNLLLTFGLLSAFAFAARAQVAIIPQPVQVSSRTGTVRIDAGTAVSISTAAQKSFHFLNRYLGDFYGFRLQGAASKGSAHATISILLDPNQSAVRGAYSLTVNNSGINIKSENEEGLFYGVQSLIQLLPVPDTTMSVAAFRLRSRTNGLAIPCVTIHDYPRFTYRGMHLDVARHFFPVSFVKRYIDYIALHKMNYFHWHLTDDQGWRIAIKKYPLLTKIGAVRHGTIVGHHPGTYNDNLPYGGFYTQEDIRDVVQYAADRYITVIPEIELPGHASAAIAAYPELSCFPGAATVMTGPVSRASQQQPGKKVQETWGVFEDVFCPTDYTFQFLEDVLDEVMALFPSQYIHIGGDECPTDAWKAAPFCQDLMKREGLKDEHELQSYFIRRIEQYLNKKGRKIIGWDEILEGGLAPNATVMSWRGETGGIAAAAAGHDVIMTPGQWVYFDHAQTKNEDSLTIGGLTTIQQVYRFEPVPPGLDGSKRQFILGAQANMWSEYLASPAKVSYQLYPRMSALSEVLWSPAESRAWPAFQFRLMEQLKRYHLWGAPYSRAIFDPANEQ